MINPIDSSFKLRGFINERGTNLLNWLIQATSFGILNMVEQCWLLSHIGKMQENSFIYKWLQLVWLVSSLVTQACNQVGH
jgi:hypothetical protein